MTGLNFIIIDHEAFNMDGIHKTILIALANGARASFLITLSSDEKKKSINKSKQ